MQVFWFPIFGNTSYTCLRCLFTPTRQNNLSTKRVHMHTAAKRYLEAHKHLWGPEYITLGIGDHVIISCFCIIDWHAVGLVPSMFYQCEQVLSLTIIGQPTHNASQQESPCFGMRICRSWLGCLGRSWTCGGDQGRTELSVARGLPSFSCECSPLQICSIHTHYCAYVNVFHCQHAVRIKYADRLQCALVRVEAPLRSTAKPSFQKIQPELFSWFRWSLIQCWQARVRELCNNNNDNNNNNNKIPTALSMNRSSSTKAHETSMKHQWTCEEQHIIQRQQQQQHRWRCTQQHSQCHTQHWQPPCMHMLGELLMASGEVDRGTDLVALDGALCFIY